MRFLKQSHKDYLEQRMPEVIAHIQPLIDCSHGKHGELLMRFCEKYRQEVVAHFDYEEQIVFPYIEGLLGGARGDYKIKDYERNHSNIEAALNDLKNIILKYLPPEYTIAKCRDMLIQLFLFESDLANHTLLEERILIALVERIENNFS
jgi:regulator of cell morphogenesis and NO signaling